MNNQQQICARCRAVLESGKAPFFEVKIEAVSDPGIPDLEDLANGCDDLGGRVLEAGGSAERYIGS